MGFLEAVFSRRGGSQPALTPPLSQIPALNIQTADVAVVLGVWEISTIEKQGEIELLPIPGKRN